MPSFDSYPEFGTGGVRSVVVGVGKAAVGWWLGERIVHGGGGIRVYYGSITGSLS